MPLPRKIDLKPPLSETADLAGFVEDCLAAKVALVAVWGGGAAVVEDEIGRLIVGDGANETRFFTTSAHAADDNVIAFARARDDCGALRIMTL